MIQIGDNITLYHGDCRDVLKALPDASVQSVITSPPYWGLRDYGHDDQIGLETTPQQYVADMVAIFREVSRVLRDDGTVWLNLGDTYASTTKRTCGPAAEQNGQRFTTPRKVNPGLPAKNLLGIPWRVAFALQDDGWILRQEIIWHKPDGMPEGVTDRCGRNHEYVFLLAKRPRYYFDADAIKIRSDLVGRRSYEARKSPTIEIKKDRVDANGRRFFVIPEMVNRRTVWSIASQHEDGPHFALMPPKLATLCVLAGSKPGDIILDPFAGGCTTGLVASRYGRGFVGIELNEKYLQWGADRVRREHSQASIF